MIMNNVQIYTKGEVIEGGNGRWSAVIVGENFYKEISGAAHNTDKNRMELVAIANALSTIKEESSIFILSDSQFVVNGFNRGWIANWKSNGWVRGQNQKVFNIDVLDYILNASKKHSISFRWLQDFSMVNESRRAEELIQYRKN